MSEDFSWAKISSAMSEMYGLEIWLHAVKCLLENSSSRATSIME